MAKNRKNRSGGDVMLESRKCVNFCSIALSFRKKVSFQSSHIENKQSHQIQSTTNNYRDNSQFSNDST